MPFLPPNQQRQSTEGICSVSTSVWHMVTGEGRRECANDDGGDELSSRVVYEVRQLRLQLELCVGNNDMLRQRLEHCARNHHSTRCSACRRLLTAQTGQSAAQLQPVAIELVARGRILAAACE